MSILSKVLRHGEGSDRKKKLVTPGAIGPMVEVLAIAYREKLAVAKAHHYEPKERYEAMMDIRQEYVLEVEKFKNQVLTEFQAMVSQSRQNYREKMDAEDSTYSMRSLRDLERAKLDVQRLSDGELIKRVRAAVKSQDYNEDEMRIIATRGGIIQKKVEELFDRYPPDTDELTRDTIGEVEAIISTGRGTIPYRSDEVKLWGALNSMELLNEPYDPDPEPPTHEEKREAYLKGREAVIRTIQKSKVARENRKVKMEAEKLESTRKALEAELAEVRQLKATLQKPSIKKTKEAIR